MKKVSVDITGQRFGRLVAVRFYDKNKFGLERWVFKCDCGKEKIIVKNQVVYPYGTRSCGCLKSENGKKLGSFFGSQNGDKIRAKQKQGIVRKDNKSGFTGVFLLKNGKYVSYITYKGVRHSKISDTLQEAIINRKLLEKKIGI